MFSRFSFVVTDRFITNAHSNQKIKIIQIALFLFLSFYFNAQHLVSAKLLDGKSGEPIPYANIWIIKKRSINIALTIPLLAFFIYIMAAFTNKTDFYINSDKFFIENHIDKNLPMYHWEKKSYSSQFYSKGSIKTIEDNTDLSKNIDLKQPFLIIIPHKKIKKIDKESLKLLKELESNYKKSIYPVNQFTNKRIKFSTHNMSIKKQNKSHRQDILFFYGFMLFLVFDIAKKKIRTFSKHKWNRQTHRSDKQHAQVC